MSTIRHGWAVASLEGRISAHVQAWDKARQSGRGRPAETYPFVTISREFGCEATLLASRLQEILNERCRPFFTWVAYDQELLDKVAQELHLARAVVESVDGHRRNAMSELFDAILNRGVDEAILFRKLAEVVRALAIHGHSIIVGRGSYLITQDLRTGLHIRLVAPRDWRVHKVATDRSITMAESAKIVAEGERERDQYIKTFFTCDPKHPFSHDLVVDNSRYNLAQIAEIVFTALSVRFGEHLVGA
jgi:cytidylate kinase